MIVVAEVRLARPGRPDGPPAGAPVRVQVRDTSRADAAATVVAEVTTTVNGALGSWLTTVEVEVPAGDPQASLELWVHVDTDGNGRIDPGEYLTTQSYPLPGGRDEVSLTVTVNRV